MGNKKVSKIDKAIYHKLTVIQEKSEEIYDKLDTIFVDESIIKSQLTTKAKKVKHYLVKHIKDPKTILVILILIYQIINNSVDMHILELLSSLLLN